MEESVKTEKSRWRSKKVWVGLIAIIIIVIAAVSAYMVTYRPPVEETIKIGCPIDLTGPYALLGSKMMAGATLAEEHINAKGGVLGKNLTLVFGDTESGKVEKGVAVVERMITKDKVVGIVGHFLSSVLIADMEVSHKYGIPTIGTSTMALGVLQKGYYDVFRYALNTSYSNERLIDFMMEYLPPRGLLKYGLVVPSTETGKDMAKFIPERIKAAGKGAEVINIDILEVVTTDFYPTLTKCKTLGVQVIFTGFGGAAEYALVTQARDLDYPVVFLCQVPDWQFAEAKKVVGDWMNLRVIDVVRFVPGIPVSPLNIPFTEGYRKKYGEDPAYCAAEIYDGITIMCEAIKRAGTTDGPSIAKALHEGKFDGVCGSGMYFLPSGQIVKEIYVIQWQQNFKPVVLYPSQWKTGEFIPPPV